MGVVLRLDRDRPHPRTAAALELTRAPPHHRGQTGALGEP
jgi:hypothetical protein